LFPGVPIVFATVAIPEVSVNRGPPGITGVMRDATFAETLELALNLHPSVKRAFVVAQSPAVNGYDERVRLMLSRFSDRVELNYIKERTIPALLAAVKAIPPQSVIIYLRYTPIEVTRIVYSDEIVRLMAEVSPVPIYGTSESYIDKGVVGGMMQSTSATGTRLGEIVREILDGTPPESIPIASMPTMPIFDWRQVKRWGINPSKLPAGSEIRFRTPSAWETYHTYIVGTIIVITAQLVLIAGLLTERVRRRRAEQTILAREASLQTSYEQIRQMAARLISAQDATRTSIARDLHDDVCQRLASLSMAVNTLQGSSGNIQDPPAQQTLNELAGDAHGALDSIRRISHELHPATLRVLGLAPALKTYCAEVAQRYHVQVNFTTEGNLGYLHPDVAVCLFRIAQESLRNGVVHGDVQRFDVSLTPSGQDVVLTVADDGRGFDLEAVQRHGRGLGLVSIEERARMVGGNVQIITGPGGTTIRVRCRAESRSVGGPDVGLQTETTSPARSLVVS
jgi:signal transduction histidine kinase